MTRITNSRPRDFPCKLIFYLVEHHAGDKASSLIRKLRVRDQSDSRIQSQRRQQKSYLRLSKFLSRDFPDAILTSVKQGLYLPAFEKRSVRINGKCSAITRAFSQTLFLQQGTSYPHAESLLNNLQTSTLLYERLAQGQQISSREERALFALSQLLDKFEQQLDSLMSSLPSTLSDVKRYKTRDDLSRYLTEFKNDCAASCHEGLCGCDL